MACHPIKMPDGTTGIVCTRGRTKRCSVPGCDRASARQCDFPVSVRKSGTCDAHLCASHATSGGPELDYCPPHAAAVKRNGQPPGTQGTLL